MCRESNFQFRVKSPTYEKYVPQQITTVFSSISYYIPCPIAHYGRQSSVSIFQKFFTSIEKIFVLEGRMNTRL